MTSKNYYAVLGVLSNAEDIVIRGAYRALAQRYHPDKNISNQTDAAGKMAEINEAYAVLSDPVKRKEYDLSQRGKSGKAAGSYEDEQSESNEDNSDTDDYFEKDWKLACSIYTSLPKIYADLKTISHALADTYRIYMLETKQFDKRREIAERMEQQFLTTYFGDNSELHDFARELLRTGRRDAALALNQLVRVVGCNDPHLLIKRIQGDFKIILEAEREAQKKYAATMERQKREDAEQEKRGWLAKNWLMVLFVSVFIVFVVSAFSLITQKQATAPLESESKGAVEPAKMKETKPKNVEITTVTAQLDTTPVVNPLQKEIQLETMQFHAPEMIVIHNKNYEIGKFEVTRGQFEIFVNETSYDAGGGLAFPRKIVFQG